MFGTFSDRAARFTLLYRGYEIEVTRVRSGWLAGVYPRTADLPILRSSEVLSCDQDAAVVEAKRRVTVHFTRACTHKSRLVSSGWSTSALPPKAGHSSVQTECLLSAKSGHECAASYC